MPDAVFPRTPGLLGSIFEESSTGDRTMREALFLTFNVDLGFFEDRVLGPTRATGAAVTVIADATVFAPDPRAVRSAGRTYALGLAHHARAFHPKLTVLASTERALIGIGSGNLTIGGWHANNEVLTTIRASRTDGTPVVVGEIAQFLRHLPEVITIGALAAQGIDRTAAVLERLVETSEPVDTPHRLAHSLFAPIVSQLPEGSAEELQLAAPFHDEHGRALAELVARYRPKRITVLAQPGRAVMQPDALVSAAGSAQLRFTQLDGEPTATTAYRHGKILSALDADGRVLWNLTGSPNLTAAALLRAASAAAPGNCELAVVTFTGVSLLPAPTVAVADLPSLNHRLPPLDAAEHDDTSASVGISEARLTSEGLLVVLSRAAKSDVAVLVSPYRDPPDQLRPLGVIPSGQDRGVFGGAFEPGTRVHAGLSVHFVTDPDQVQNRLRPTSGSAGNSNTSHTELFASQVLAQQWQKTLGDLVLSQRFGAADTAAAGPVGRGAAEQRQSGEWWTLDNDSAWNNYLDSAQSALGLPMFLLAAGPVAISPVGAALPNAAPAWEDRFEETVDTFEEEQTAETLEADTETSPAQAASTQPMTPGQRHYYRSWLARLADMVGVLGPIEAIAATQLVVVGAGAHCWDGERGPNGWFETVHTALTHLVRDDWPERLVAQAASVFAIGLYRLRQATPADGRGREPRMLRELAITAVELLPHVSDELVEDNLVLLDGAHVVAPSSSDIVDNALDLMTDAPDETLLSLLARALPELDATWTGPHQLLVQASTSKLLQIAARVLDLAQEFDTIAVMVQNPHGEWALLAVAHHRLTIVEAKQGVRYTTHALSPLATPLSLVLDGERLQRARISQPPFNTPGTAELEVFDRARVDTLPLPDAVRAKIATP